MSSFNVLQQMGLRNSQYVFTYQRSFSQSITTNGTQRSFTKVLQLRNRNIVLTICGVYISEIFSQYIDNKWITNGTRN